MIRNRSTRVLATLGVSISLALTALAGPATILAAQARADFSSVAVLQEVSPNGYIAYDVSFDLAVGETSSLAQLSMSAATPTGWDLIGIESGAFPGTCDDDGTNLSCTFGGMAPADPAITMRVVYQVGSQTGLKTVHFLFKTTGVAGDKNKQSHGDDYDAFDEISVESNADLAASYVQSAGEIVASDEVSRRNPQSTKVTSPAANIIVIAGEDSDIGPCQAQFSDCFGQASVINVDNGSPFGQPGFTVDIVFNANKPGAEYLHIFDDGTIDEDLVECGEVPVAPCYEPSTAQGKTFVTLHLLENGKIFGH
jgi:hypothetical protein